MILDFYKNIKKEINDINTLLKNTNVFNSNVLTSAIDKDTLTQLNMGYSSDGKMTSNYSSAIEKLSSSYNEATAKANALKMAQDGLSESTVKDILVKQNWSEEERNAAINSEIFKKAQQSASIATQLDTNATWLNVAATKALSVAKKTLSIIGGMIFTTAISIGINSFVKFTDSLVSTRKELKETAETAKQTVDDIKSSFDTLKSNTDNIKKRYAELAQGVDQFNGKNLTLSNGKYEEFLDLSNQLSELFPHLTKNYDDNNNAILKLSGNVDSIVSSLDALIKKEQELANQKILDNMSDIYKDLEYQVSGYNKEIEHYQTLSNVLPKDFFINNHGETSFSFKDIDGDVVSNNLYDYIKEQLSSKFVEYNLDGLSAEIQYNSAEGAHEFNISGLENTKEYYDKLGIIYDEIRVDIIKQIQEINGSIETEMNSFNQYLYTWLSTDWNYSKMDNGLQTAIQQILFNSNWIGDLPDSINSNDWDQVSKWLEDNYLNAINEINDEEYKQKLIDLFTMNLNPEEKINIAQELQNYFDENNIKVSLDFILNRENQNSTANLVQRFNTKNKELSGGSVKKQSELEQFFKDYSIDTDQEYNKWLEITNGITNANAAMNAYKESVKQSQSDSDFFTDENLESINEYKSKISDLSSYLEKLNSGNELSSEEMANLNTTYGITANSIEEYRDEIIKIIDDTIYSSEIMNVLSEEISNCNDSAQKEQLQSLYDNLKNLGIEAKTGADSIRDLDTVITNLKDKAQMIRNINDNMKELGHIDGSDLDEIIAKYPRLANKVAEYNAGIIKSTELFEALTSAYDTDVRNYAIAVGEKLKMDETYYSNVLLNIPQWLTKMAEGYGIDFNNFKNLCEAKLALEKQYASKVANMERALAEANTAMAEVENKTGNSKVKAEDEAFKKFGDYKKAEKQVKDIQDMIDGIDTALVGSVDFDTSWQSFGKGIDTSGGKGKDKTGGKDKGGGNDEEESKQSIDWLEQSLKVLESEVDKFQTALDNTHGVENQIAAIDNLNSALGNLKTGYEAAYDNYETRYNSALNSLGKSKDSIKNKIESGTEFDLKEYNSETAEKIQAAIDAYNNMSETQVKIDELSKQISDNENIEKSKYRQQDYEKQLDTINEKLEDQTLSASDKNKLLDEQLEIQKSINEELRKQAEYTNDYETVDKLNQEDKNNELQNKLNQIRNNQDENQKLIDRYEEMLKDDNISMSDINDINRKLKESTNKDFKYQMESEIAKIDSDDWKKYIKDLKKKYKETKLSDKKFIKKHIEEISAYFDNTDMLKIYQEYLNSQDNFAETDYETFKNTLDYMIRDNENDTTDIKNNIESKGGRGTQEQYTQMIKLYQDNLFYLTEQKKEAEAMLNTVDEGTEAWDKWNSELQECEDNIHDCNENIKECYSSILRLPLNYVEDALAEISKNLEDINEQISDYDTIISAANAVLDDQIDSYGTLKESVQDQINALQEENDLRESLLSVQKAEWELQKAKEQKTSKIYKEGEGFVYEADMEEIQTAQENYDSALYERKVFVLEQQLNLYDEEINKLDEIKNKWNSIVSDIQNIMDINFALSYDPDFFKNVIEGDYSLIADVSGNYRRLLESQSDLEEQQNCYEKLRDIINDVVDKYEREAMTYEESRMRISSAIKVYYPEISSVYNNESGYLHRIIEQKLNNETTTIETNTSILESYQDLSDKMDDIFDDLNKLLEKFSTKSQDTIKTIKDSIDSLKSDLQDVSDDTTTFDGGSFKTKGSGNLGIVGVPRIAGKSHSGLELGYLGDGTKSGDKEAFRYIALNDLNNDEIVRVLQKSEGVITESQVMQTMDNFRKLAQVKVPTIIPNNSQTNAVSFNGDIIIQNTNGDVNSFARNLKQNLPNAFLQEMYRR